jgi:hypothetical protein
MRKFHLIGVALVAMFAFCTVAATAAFAEQPQWLVNGGAVVGTLNSETEGELNLTRLNKAMGTQQGNIKCAGGFEGTMTNPGGGGKGTGTITKVLNASMADVGNDGASLTGTGLSCEVTEDGGDITFCKVGGAGSAIVWPANLPWKTELELMANGQTLQLIGINAAEGSQPGYEVECTVLLGTKATDLCETNTSALVSLTLGTWPGTVAEGSPQEFNAESEETLCKTAGGGELIAGQLGKGVTWAVEGELNRLETDVSEL